MHCCPKTLLLIISSFAPGCSLYDERFCSDWNIFLEETEKTAKVKLHESNLNTTTKKQMKQSSNLRAKLIKLLLSQVPRLRPGSHGVHLTWVADCVLLAGCTGKNTGASKCHPPHGWRGCRTTRSKEPIK